MASSELSARLSHLAIEGGSTESGDRYIDFPSPNSGASVTANAQELDYELRTDLRVFFPDVLSRIQEDPAGTVDTLRVLVQERADDVLNNDPAIQQRLDTFFHRLENTIFLPISQLGSETWSVLLQSGLYGVVTDCIFRDGFFEESKGFMYMVFDVLTLCTHRLSKGLGEVALLDEVLNQAPTLWQAVYAHRHVLDLRVLDEHGLSTEEDLLESAVLSVFLLHHNMREEHWGNEKKAGPDTFIPQLAFYLWVRTSRSDPQMDKLLWTMEGIQTIPVGPDTDAFVDAFVLPVVSPDVLAGRVYHQLAALSTDAEKNLGLFIRLANSIVPLFMTASLKPAMDIHPTLSLLVSVTDRIVRNHPGGMSDTNRVATLQNFFIIHNEFAGTMFERITHGLPEMGRIRGEDFMTLLARLVDLMVSLGPQAEHRLRKDTPQTMRRLLRDCAAVIVDVQDSPHRHDVTGGHTLVKGLKAGARRDWWPTLRKLYRSRDRAGPQSDRHSSLIARWKELGIVLDLSEERESSRFERETRRHCSWRQCEYHRDKVAMSELKVCRGCGESAVRAAIVVNLVKRVTGREAATNSGANGSRTDRKLLSAYCLITYTTYYICHGKGLCDGSPLTVTGASVTRTRSTLYNTAQY
ncbi:hypothetical protein PENSPDRAFT_749653 [Peniophora sp. CONT]|nr:hypothetical protein PENSPDRAFT_749653 [Peniophora sp. CONT]